MTFYDFSNMFEAIEKVMAERRRQEQLYPDVNDRLQDGTGPGWTWLAPFSKLPAAGIEKVFRQEYEQFEMDNGLPTFMHLVREEVAEAFQESDPERLKEELIQVAALCVSWYERLKRRQDG